MKRITINAGALVELLRRAIEKNPNSGTYMVVDMEVGAVLCMSLSKDLNDKIKAWFDDQILKGNAAGGHYGKTGMPDAKKDTELQ